MIEENINFYGVVYGFLKKWNWGKKEIICKVF